jgi:hypothetical protein
LRTHHFSMSETPENPTRPTTVATTTTEVAKPYWLYRFAAWVVIVAGILFIAMSIFFAGFKIAGHHHHGCHHHWAQHHAMGPGGMPHGHGQGTGFHGGPGGPGGPNDYVVGPSQPPQSVAPSLAPAHP